MKSTQATLALGFRFKKLRVNKGKSFEFCLVNVADDFLVRRCEDGRMASEKAVEVLSIAATL